MRVLGFLELKGNAQLLETWNQLNKTIKNARLDTTTDQRTDKNACG